MQCQHARLLHTQCPQNSVIAQLTWAQHSVVLAAALALAAATLLTAVVVELCSRSKTSKVTGLLMHCQSMCTKSTSWGHTLTYSYSMRMNDERGRYSPTAVTVQTAPGATCHHRCPSCRSPAAQQRRCVLRTASYTVQQLQRCSMWQSQRTMLQQAAAGHPRPRHDESGIWKAPRQTAAAMVATEAAGVVCMAFR